MTPPQTTPDAGQRQGPCRWRRLDAAEAFADFADPFDPPASQRGYARQTDIPRSTLGYWLRQMRHDQPSDLEPELVALLRGPAGERFLRRVVLAALLVFQQSGTCGIRSVGRFLQLARLDRFVGASYGALHPLAQSVQRLLGAFDDEERPRLAALMPPKAIAVCADENFHGEHPCLVAIEPVSDFLLLETYAARRDAPTWTAALRLPLQGLPVEVTLLCSDRARGLLCCAQGGLGVPHSPDLFHQQRDLLRPVLLPLTRPIREAQKDLRQARAQTQRLDEAHQGSLPGPSRGRRIDYFGRLVESVRAEGEAEEALAEAQEQLEQALAPVRGLGDDYHPFDRQTGRPVTAGQVQARLGGHVDKLRQLAEQADLSEQALQRVQEARSWLVALVGCVAWFWAQVQRRVEALGLSEEGERLLRECLLAGCYWQAAARRAREAQERQRLQELAGSLHAQAWAEGGALAALDEKEREEVERVARECAGLFARSSSCVEGRNGRLALHHHGQGRLSAGRLKALGVVHNYLSRREDGTTAAERFFGHKPRDLFAWLLERLPELPRPAAKRPKQRDQALPKAG